MTSSTAGEAVLTQAAFASPQWLPVWFLLSFGAAKIGATFFSELRTFLFARVVQKSCRVQGLTVFQHLHRLPISYLLSLKGGEVQSVMNRAIKSMQQVLTAVIFNLGPTGLEFALVVALVTAKMGVLGAGTVCATFGGYAWFTTWFSNRRREYMKKANASEDKLGGLLVDSIMNCEAIRYFGTQKREAQKYDKSLADYEKHTVTVLQSLAFLNFFQQLILNTGMLAIMGWSTSCVLAGTMPVGDVVMWSEDEHICSLVWEYGTRGDRMHVVSREGGL